MKGVRPGSHGFTLPELLVVMGVVFVLLGLSLPVLSRSRVSGERAACLSQMRDIGLVLGMYADDNNDTWPSAMEHDSNEGVWAIVFRDKRYPMSHQRPPLDYFAFQVTWHAPLVDTYYDGQTLHEALYCPQNGESIEEDRAIYAMRGEDPDTSLYQTPRLLSMALGLEASALATDIPAPGIADMRMTRRAEMLFPSQKCVLFESPGLHDEYPDIGAAARPAGSFSSHSILAGDGAVSHRSRAGATVPVMFTELPGEMWFDGIDDDSRRRFEGFNTTRDGVRGRDW